ncbi:F-box/LRR-repeat protein At3g58900-like [Pyrus communis]|uniref:F-box/LRR-repeat protein At3g58900-like n=1 Tax=Pyrus communis TaxID=23211 RepID=UPI0035C0AAAC
MEEEEANDQNRSLNDLPEDLLLRILTFLPTLASVQTSIISQKWRPLWSLVPSLDFRFELFPPRELPLDTCQFYAEFVDRVLISRPNSPVHTFRLTFIFHDHYHSHVDSWVRSAVTHLRARELHLDFFIHRDFHNDETHNYHYDFPFSFLRNGCVEKLSLTRCFLTLPAKLSTMRFWTIRSLLLDMVCLEDQMMNDLILGCPNLEDLELQNCWGHHHLKICSKRLKRLAFGFFYDSEIRETVSIDCPNLCSITFDCCSFYRFALKNAASLVYFRVQIVNIMERYYDLWSRTVKLIEQAPNLKHLDALNWWFKFLTSTDSFPESFMLHNLKFLELQTGFTKHDLIGMAALLKHCPNLETMILEYPFKSGEDESLPEELSDKSVEFSIPSLKQVTIKPYTGTEDEGNFVKILTEQGVVLEKIVLVPGQVGENGIVLMQVPPIVLYKKDSQSWKYSLLRNARCTLSFKLGIHRLSPFPCYFLD